MLFLDAVSALSDTALQYILIND